jgi:hydrogenase maturation protein HypF
MAEKAHVELKFNRILSSNDENISLGQLWYHQHIKN